MNRMINRYRVRSVCGLDGSSLLFLNREEIEERACRKQTVFAYGRPRVFVGHVVDSRKGGNQLVTDQRPPHLRRSMILRSGRRKRVTTKDTGADATRSISSMNRIVVSSSCSNVAERLKLPLVSRKLGASRPMPHVLGAVGEERVGYLVGNRIPNSRRRTSGIEFDPESLTASHRNGSGVADTRLCYDLDSAQISQKKRIERWPSPPLIQRLEYEFPRFLSDGVHRV